MRIIILMLGLSFGLYFIIADRLKIPYLKTSKAIMNMGRTDRRLTSVIETVIMDMSMRLSRIIPMDKYKRNRLQSTLNAAGIKMTAECYQAHAIIKAIAVGLLVIPCLAVFPLLSALVLTLAVLMYFKEYQRAEKQLEKKKEVIDGELTRFVLSIGQELQSSRDVLSMLESFRKNTVPEFADELGITCADMHSGGYEAALMRMEARVNSPQLSDVVRGLISVIRGDNGVMYFQMLSHEFKQTELRRLKAQAQKIPPKIRIFSMVMLMCFLATYLVIIAIQVIQSAEILF
ncbi:MAG: secretion protein F [Clostridia bacterium]|nr:secretion protein F [Clostridia bacterium]